jgi:hypothetical protein
MFIDVFEAFTASIFKLKTRSDKQSECCFSASLAYNSTLKMEAVFSSEMLRFCQITRRYIPEHNTHSVNTVVPQNLFALPLNFS